MLRLIGQSPALTPPRTVFRAFLGVRYKPQVPDTRKNAPGPGEWKQLKQHIPGETTHSDGWKQRMPKFPLGKENVPTLLPRPGVPQVGPNMTFRQVLQILKRKKEPELIYEAEPHRLYFLACFCCGVMFTVYGVVLAEYAWFQANEDYEKNERELTGPVRKREWFISLVKYLGFGATMFVAAFAVAKFPTRLIRRMWYLPGPVEHVRFTTYPLVPGTATPVYTVPLANILRKHKSRVWTGRGFYGTADSSLFFFVLKEVPSGKNWIVDRKGFFWSDGRVFDFLFGKETIAEAEAGIPYDEQVGIVNREVEKKRKELRQKHGFFYKWKIQAQDMKADANRAVGYIKNLRGQEKIEEKSEEKEQKTIGGKK